MHHRAIQNGKAATARDFERATARANGIYECKTAAGKKCDSKGKSASKKAAEHEKLTISTHLPKSKYKCETHCPPRA